MCIRCEAMLDSFQYFLGLNLYLLSKICNTVFAIGQTFVFTGKVNMNVGEKKIESFFQSCQYNKIEMTF